MHKAEDGKTLKREPGPWHRILGLGLGLGPGVVCRGFRVHGLGFKVAGLSY